MKSGNTRKKAESLSYWTNLSKTKKKLIVFYGDDVLDLTQFAHRHPAGEKAIATYNLQDVKNILFRVYPHSNSILGTLFKYNCGKLIDHEENLEQSQHKGICKQKSYGNNKKQEGTKKVTFAMKKTGVKKQETHAQTKQKIYNELDKIEENSQNLEENKPFLKIPFFSVRIFGFSGKQNSSSRIITQNDQMG